MYIMYICTCTYIHIYTYTYIYLYTYQQEEEAGLTWSEEMVLRSQTGSNIARAAICGFHLLAGIYIYL